MLHGLDVTDYAVNNRCEPTRQEFYTDRLNSTFLFCVWSKTSKINFFTFYRIIIKKCNYCVILLL